MSEQGELDNRRGTTRRRFLKDSAMLASGAALGTLALSRSVHAAGEGTIKIGMIGAGGRCSGAAAESMQASPDVKLVAICDLFEDRVKGARDNLKAQAPNQVVVDDDHCFAGFDGYQKVIDSADAVMIACASKFHPMYAEAAIKAGKHVFVEKPHAIDPVGVRRMAAVCDLAKTKGLSILSGLQSRFDNGWQETVQRIHDGAIGDIVAMQSMFLRGPYRLEARQPNATEMQFQYRNWYHFLWAMTYPSRSCTTSIACAGFWARSHPSGPSVWAAGPPPLARCMATCSTTIRSSMNTRTGRACMHFAAPKPIATVMAGTS
jgi:myo-inositol 2-dehydrogenase/D-chiro-inositol 1-dehydrogenase